MEELGLGESQKETYLAPTAPEGKRPAHERFHLLGRPPGRASYLRELPLAADRLLWAMAVPIHLEADDLFSTSSGRTPSKV